MISSTVLLASVLLNGAVATPPSPSPSPPRIAQLILRERVIIRVPTQPMQLVPPEIRWREKAYSKCLPADRIGGAILTGPDRVDFIIRGNFRIRAELESSCPALDYYNGFYLRPATDGQICAGRDSVHARSGGECQIKRFRRLIPRP